MTTFRFESAHGAFLGAAIACEQVFCALCVFAAAVVDSPKRQRFTIGFTSCNTKTYTST
jgi:hypothetical protein